MQPVRLEAEMEDIDDLLRTTEQPAIVKPKPVNPRAQKDPIEESSEDEFIDSEALTVQGRTFLPVSTCRQACSLYERQHVLFLVKN